MKNQKELIKNGNWDYIFLLDACRFDYLEKNYGKYFDGDLKKVRSSGSMTKEWIKKTFSDIYLDDVVYVSGNPWLNSGFSFDSFNPWEHFYKVIDVWKDGWDTETGAVEPSKVIDGVKEADVKYPEKKKIAHFMQPHAPYINLLKNGTRSTKIVDSFFSLISKVMGDSGEGKNPIAKIGGKTIRKSVGSSLVDFLGHKGVSELRRLLKLPPGPVWDLVNRKGVEFLRKQYSINLNIVLEEISRSLPSSTVVLTADHGELLGEKISEFSIEERKEFFKAQSSENRHKRGVDFLTSDGFRVVYGHPAYVHFPILRDVPWLRVDDVA